MQKNTTHKIIAILLALTAIGLVLLVIIKTVGAIIKIL